MNGYEASEAPDYPVPSVGAQAALAKSARPLTQREQLDHQKKALEAQLARVNAALEALDQHPDIEKVMTLVSNALYARF